MNKSFRKTIWCNVLSKEFLETRTNLIKENDKPTWVISPKKKEPAHTIGILRGLFWQPAKVKLEIINSTVTGFLKETGPCEKNGHWLHPHTPIDMERFQKNKNEEKPYLAASKNAPLWSQMMSFFYLHKEFSPIEKEGHSSSLVVQQYRDIWRKGINLSVGGYVKGNSTESIAGRKHELYSLSSGWGEQAAEINKIISFGLKAQNILNHAVNLFGRIAIEEKAISIKDVERIINEKDKKRAFGKKENKFKSELKKKAKQEYFNNSENLMHSIFRRLNIKHEERYKQEFASLAHQVFENIVSPYEHVVKMQPAIINSCALLKRRLKKM